ncbi:IPT/TIG domain-containing protein [Streptomyces sp. NPDC087849]
MYVPNYGGNTVDVVDLATLTVIASIPGFALPFAVTVRPDGLIAYVSSNADGTVRAISTATNTVISTYSGLSSPYTVAVAPNDLSLYIASNGIGTVSFLPGVTGLFPNQGPTGGGTPVTILGTHLTGTTAVHFGTRLATNVVVVNDNEITAVSPSGQGVAAVTVTTPGGTSNPVPFYYIQPPHILTLTPASGSVTGGTTVTVTGLNLSTAAKVAFGPTAVTPTVLSDSQLTATAPPHAAGSTPVVITTCGGVADDATYTYTTP